MEDRRIVAYCYLATINNSNSDLFKSVYLPICKRALSCYSQDGMLHGKALDIKDKIKDIYDLTVPVNTVRHMVNSIYDEMSRKEKENSGFKTFGKGDSFELLKYCFCELEEIYSIQKREVNEFEDAFKIYLVEKGIDPSKAISLSEYIDCNRKNLSVLFGANRRSNPNYQELFYHATFLKEISERNEKLYQIARKVYMGSIISAYLETPKYEGLMIKEKVTYYLDTKIALQALDLRDEEETQPVCELLEIIRKNGGNIKVLNITIDEITNAIQNAIYNLSSYVLPSSIPNASIESACYRRNITKTDLQVFCNSIEKKIREILKADIEQVPRSFIESCKKTLDYEELQKERVKQTALHDVVAYMYVRKKRNGIVSTFQKSKYWFVTANHRLTRFNRAKVEKNYISETIDADSLTSILWLSNPQIMSETKCIGLSQLIATTITSLKPDVETLIQLERNIKKYTNLQQEDYAFLVEELSNESVKKINELNHLANVENEHKFNSKIVELVKNAKETNEERSKLTDLAEEEIATAIEHMEIVKNQNRQYIHFLNNAIENENKILKDVEKLEQVNRELIEKNGLLIRRTILIILAIIVCGISFYLKSTILFLLGSIATVIIDLVIAKSGLWTFFSFLLNGINTCRTIIKGKGIK